MKWYKGKREFFRFTPKENPSLQIFPVPGIYVEVGETRAKRAKVFCPMWSSQDANSQLIFMFGFPRRPQWYQIIFRPRWKQSHACRKNILIISTLCKHYELCLNVSFKHRCNNKINFRYKALYYSWESASRKLRLLNTSRTQHVHGKSFWIDIIRHLLCSQVLVSSVLFARLYTWAEAGVALAM